MIGRLLESLFVRVSADTKGFTDGMRDTARAAHDTADEISSAFGLAGNRVVTAMDRMNHGLTSGAGGIVRTMNQQRAQMANLAFQVNDIVVSLASGMSLLIVAIQQGSQIQQIYSMQGGLRAMLSDISMMLVKLAPLAAVLAAVAGGFRILQGEVNKTTSVQVSFMDVMLGTWDAASEAVWAYIAGPLADLKSGFADAIDFIVPYFKAGMNAIIGSVAFAGKAIIELWSTPMVAMKDGFAQARNWIVEQFEAMVNKLLEMGEVFGNELRGLFGLDPLAPGRAGRVSMADYILPVNGTGAVLGERLRTAWEEAMGRDYMGEAFDAIREKAIARALGRVEEGAEDAGGAVGRAKEKVDELKDAVETLDDPMERAAENFVSLFTNAFEEFVRTGKLSVKDFIISMNAMMAQNLGQAIMQGAGTSIATHVNSWAPWLSSALGTLFGGFTSGAPTSAPLPIPRPRARGGLQMPWDAMIAGENGAELITRSGPSSARRVYTPGQTSAMMGGGGRDVHAHFHFHQPTDVDGFRRSKTQIASSLRRVVAKGERNS
jgi:phage-related minor tail protein